MIQGVDFDLIEKLSITELSICLYLIYSCREITNSKQFVKFATAVRHRGLNTIYIKHNLFHQSKLGRDVELQNTHIVLFKSPRDVLQINTLSQQLGLGSQLKEWYQEVTTSVPYGHWLIDLTPKTVDSHSYCSNSRSVPTSFCLPAGIETKLLNNECTIRLYSPIILKNFSKTSKTIHSQLSGKFLSVSERVFSKPIKRRPSGSLERRRSKISKINFRTNTKRTPQHKRRIFLGSIKGLQLISTITNHVIKRLT